jgi:cytochrome c peroxidase
LDNFILNTETIEEHEEEGLKLFETMKQANIKCSKNKSEMVTQEVQFLGNTISNGNIYPSKNRANAINQKPQPQLLNELQAWLGTANYLRRYIKDYAEITQPLYQMMDLKMCQNIYARKMEHQMVQKFMLNGLNKQTNVLRN